VWKVFISWHNARASQWKISPKKRNQCCLPGSSTSLARKVEFGINTTQWVWYYQYQHQYLMSLVLPIPCGFGITNTNTNNQWVWYYQYPVGLVLPIPIPITSEFGITNTQWAVVLNFKLSNMIFCIQSTLVQYTENYVTQTSYKASQSLRSPLGGKWKDKSIKGRNFSLVGIYCKLV